MFSNGALPNDIRNIIYRYCFDHNYKSLIQQYNSKFLIHWNTISECFTINNDRFLANWRDLDFLSSRVKKTSPFPIFGFRFDGGASYKEYVLPPNYFRAVLY